MIVKDAIRYITERLEKIYDKGEAKNIADWVVENITGNTDKIAARHLILTNIQIEKLKVLTGRLLKQEPVQYVLNESWFSGIKFYVDENVLIPRPETEELIEWIISNCKFPLDKLKILDIGTGSGCIPVSLKRRMRKAEVWSCDISKGAIAVAKKNAEELGAEVNFLNLDFLDNTTWSQLPSFNIIVSNPPYIPEKDRETMQPNVLEYEPATALFVPDNDALVFYKAIAQFGKAHLEKDGNIFMEIHESLGREVTGLFQEDGYSTEIKKDMQEKDRMVKAGLV